MTDKEIEAYNKALTDLIESIEPRLEDDFSATYRLAVAHVIEEAEMLMK